MDRGLVRTRLGLRAGLLTSTPKLPPPVSHSQSQPSADKLPHLDVSVKPSTEFEKYAGTQENPRPSKFGGTDIERCADNVAADELGFEFDYAQIPFQLTMNGSYTIVDRVMSKAKTLVYLDGIVHFIRPDSAAQDLIQKIELESMGYLVVRLSYLDLMRDPVGTVRQVLYAV